MIKPTIWVILILTGAQFKNRLKKHKKVKKNQNNGKKIIQIVHLICGNAGWLGNTIETNQQLQPKQAHKHKSDRLRDTQVPLTYNIVGLLGNINTPL